MAEAGDNSAVTDDPLAPAQPGAEQRAAPRFSLLIRAAKLVADCGEYLCIVRDISATGTRLKLFHDLPPQPCLFLELANGERFALERVWHEEGHAGFRFSAMIDVDAFVAEAGAFRRRPVRLRMQHTGLVFTGGQIAAATLHDVSQQGARIESRLHMAVGQMCRLEVEGMPPRVAKVRWRRGDGYGLVFEQTFRLDELAATVWAVQSGPLARQARCA